jgi:aminoglycoside N3'-acetyltransferase
MVAGLKSAGLAAGDLVIVHTSLSAFGKVQGGPDTLIDAILDVLAPAGTVIFPTFAGVKLDHLELTPQQNPAYTGIVPVTASRRPGFVNSTHPFYACCGHGPLAQEICQFNDRRIFPSAKDKFIYRMGELGGKVLLLGVTHDNNSAVHLVEEFSRVEYKVQDLQWWNTTIEEFRALPREKRQEAIDRHLAHNLPYRPAVHLNAIDQPLRRIGAIRTVRIGNAQCHLMKIMDVVRVGEEESRKNPWFLCDKVGKA